MWVRSTSFHAAGRLRRRKQTLRKAAEIVIKMSTSCFLVSGQPVLALWADVLSLGSMQGFLNLTSCITDLGSG